MADILELTRAFERAISARLRGRRMLGQLASGDDL
jgi:hypothetical protein